MSSSSPQPTLFTPFTACIAAYSLPEEFTNPFNEEPHPLSLLAAEELQHHLQTQQDWEHNFGLQPEQEGAVIGKMFGVLVVRNQLQEIGYLSAFSGKLAGGFHHKRFVPPVFDSLTQGSFLNRGMQELSHLNAEIKSLQAQEKLGHQPQIEALKERRKNHSIALQGQLFDQFHFHNKAGKQKSLRQIFRHAANGNPPAGAGECAAPKLLQYAFQNKLEPLALAEFWWGKSPKSAYWKHGQFYPACREKCAPILSHMLEDVVLAAQSH
ncbi:pseudouridylate synthase [Rufibacter radiotolerans]|uniref:Pseudouridylate synthase n=1 Tax=Rufibacter radiotolerans TaxID=1379910 RepID=A0A0H4VV89_9BACT|nr:pseudouridylate synthase [Rufibacter radiotolerans]